MFYRGKIFSAMGRYSSPQPSRSDFSAPILQIRMRSTGMDVAHVIGNAEEEAEADGGVEAEVEADGGGRAKGTSLSGCGPGPY